MKKIILPACILALISPSYLNAQQKEFILKKIYIEQGAGTISKNGSFVNFGVEAVHNKKWLTSVSYYEMSMQPRNLPANYNPPNSSFLWVPIPGEIPTIDMKIVTLTIGKFVAGGRKVWLTSEAGLSFVNGEKATFKPASINQSNNDPLAWIGIITTPGNYSMTKEKKRVAGGVLKADFNWAFSPFFGVGAGVVANLNSIQSSFCYEIKLIGGWFNIPKKK
jgi:hypothetical protein